MASGYGVVDPITKAVSTEFQLFEDLLSKAILASYLLGLDVARDEIIAELRKNSRQRSEFAEGDGRRGARSVTWLPYGKDQSGATIDSDDSPISIDLRFDVPPQEAIDYFRRKRSVSPEEFYRLDAEARAGAFTVSRVYRDDMIEGFRTEILNALENGIPERETVKRLRSILDGGPHAILSNRRLETIVRTNMMVAYGVGRRAAMDEVRDVLPVWEYSAVGDDRTRPSHRALDGVTYPADHPFWDQYYPPWDFGCRCTVIPLPSVPKGYDHAKPNGIDSVEYDAAGLPSKGVVDGETVSLRPGGFRGIPRRASLGDAISSGVRRKTERPLEFHTSTELEKFTTEQFSVSNRSITKEEVDTIRQYGSDAYSHLNRHLRGLSPDPGRRKLTTNEIDSFIRHLDSAIAKGRVTKPVKLYRGMGIEKGQQMWKPGDVIQELGFASTSPLRNVAEKFAGYAKDRGLRPFILEFDIPPGTNAVYVENFLATREFEFLLARGHSFEIISTRIVKGVTYAKARLAGKLGSN